MAILLGLNGLIAYTVFIISDDHHCQSLHRVDARPTSDGEDVNKVEQVSGPAMRTRHILYDWGNAVILALGTGVLVSVLFGGAVLFLSWGSAG